LFRTQLHMFSDLESWLTVHAGRVWCADMEGDPMDQVDLSDRPYVLLGNEALGVSPKIARIKGLHKVTIPRIGKAESLNAAAAAAIFAWKLRHRS
jgi:RNA methyltransferase, TrmH family